MALHIPRRHMACGAFRGRTMGFTLMELLVALTVVSVGTAILIKSFNTSLNLASTSKHRIVATQLAEAKLNEIISNPEMYVLEASESDQEDRFANPVRLLTSKGDDPQAGMLFEGPKVQPYTNRAQQLNENLYGEMRWRAYLRASRDTDGNLIPEPKYIDLIVEVLWEQQGRTQALAYTSLLDYDQLPPEYVAPEEVAEPEAEEVESPEVEVTNEEGTV